MTTNPRAYSPLLMALIGAVVGSAMTFAGAMLVMPAKGDTGAPGPQGTVGNQGPAGPPGDLSGLSGTTVLSRFACPTGLNALSPIVRMTDNYGDVQEFRTCAIP